MALGDIMAGEVLRLQDFGVFLRLDNGVECLLPFSEMAGSETVSAPSDLVDVGSLVEECRVIKIDGNKVAVTTKPEDERGAQTSGGALADPGGVVCQ